MTRLLTIPISHYCEKARWALDRAGIAYREERHVQGIHQLIARRAGGGSTLPVLVTPERTITQSAEILSWADERTAPDRRLLPAEPRERAEQSRLCARLDELLGPAGRRLIYVHLLPRRDLVMAFNNAGVPRWEGRALRVGWPIATRFIGHVLGIRPGVEVEDEAIVWREFDAVAELLADGRPYLAGERFGASDLTFAALSAAVTAPPQYGVALPQPDVLPAKTADLVRRARAHPAGRHAMALYERHRHEPTA